MRHVLAVVLLVGSLAACHNSKSSDSTSTTTSTQPSLPRFDVVLDDAGLKLPPGSTPAAKYRISFEDRRLHPPAGERAALQFRPTGPDIVVLEVPSGTAADGTLIANLEAQVAVNGAVRSVPIDHPLDVTTTPEYPTPAT